MSMGDPSPVRDRPKKLKIDRIEEPDYILKFEGPADQVFGQMAELRWQLGEVLDLKDVVSDDALTMVFEPNWQAPHTQVEIKIRNGRAKVLVWAYHQTKVTSLLPLLVTILFLGVVFCLLLRGLIMLLVQYRG